VQPVTDVMELHTLIRIHPHKQQGHVALKMHVARVCFKYFNCFRGMLQVFYTHVAKVDRVLHMLQWLYTYVASSYSQCFIYFFDVRCKYVYLDVAYVFIHMM
jgi:hypothetical protein